eukprot:CAMPEP_0181290978 /NCGR_PEP_ID=MMETSP1101-20121128/1710_1 /TAXON_ID=46948 /ORGANISM="Rhodomonas abbreviata, Strain Caron Lab Isolate" /LENGTH=354 /DNA_ID=CAMNT_0023395315 /DNA_START=118 /DNA_END=1178 /DNA_ORIENTATION=-
MALWIARVLVLVSLCLVPSGGRAFPGITTHGTESNNVPAEARRGRHSQSLEGPHTVGLATLGDHEFDARKGTRRRLGCLENQYFSTGPATIAGVAVGEGHSCVWYTNHAVYCWGKNDQGQLGLGDTQNRGDSSSHPVDANLPEVDLDHTEIQKVACGKDHCCALIQDGIVKCWGSNGEGQLGYDDADGRGSRQDHMGSNLLGVFLGQEATDIGCGESLSCALLANGKAKCWGKNDKGQLGQGNTNNVGKTSGSMLQLNDVDHGWGAGANICVGKKFVCLHLTSGKAKCWGDNSKGQLGRQHSDDLGDSSAEMGDELKQAGVSTPMTSLSCGGEHVCGLLEDGNVVCWGKGDQGR